ncbi:Pectinesterase inhibitor [Corchorus olitorius]|uniref:Pectinesterase inhibitor n=1 Tax=Corchorus olitorius TaxID=93759 RepID=A0A1R3ICQ2_9ROSI|nr:Pectinesterase inhibitor [Corchorus olitorius]
MGFQFPLRTMLFTIIPLLVLNQSLIRTTGGQEIGKALIATTCNKTEYPKDCISTLESDPRSFISNITGLARIALEITAWKANSSLIVAQYWTSRQRDYRSWDFSKVCTDYYSDSINSLKDSLKAFDEMKFDKAYQSLQSVHNNIAGCQRAGVTDFNDLNAMMLKITKYVLVVLHQLF